MATEEEIRAAMEAQAEQDRVNAEEKAKADAINKSREFKTSDINQGFKDLFGAWGLGGGVMGANSFRPSAPQLDQSAANNNYLLALAGRSNQGGLMGRLDQTMNGQGPTVAGLQQQQGMAIAAQAAMRQAANARGVGRGMAQMNAAYSRQRGQEEANRDASLLRAQEQLNARQLYGTTAMQQRQGDTQQRQLDLSAAQANQQSIMNQQQLMADITSGNAARKQKGTGAILNAAGGLVKGLSDVGAKQDIVPIMGSGPNAPTDRYPDASFSSALRDSQKFSTQTMNPQASEPQLLRMNDSALAGYGAQQAGYQRAGMKDEPLDTGGEGPTGGGMMGAIGGGMESYGQALMSDERSKEKIRQLEMELDGQQPRQLDWNNPYAGPGEPVEEGTLDLGNRPVIRNRDGSISTVRSISIGEDGREILLPTVRTGLPRAMTNHEAVDWYHRTGEHLGKFNSPEDATVRAKQIHRDQADRSRENLAPVQGYSFTYKPEVASMMAEQMAQKAPPQAQDEVRGEVYADARAPREGVMAQDLQRSPGGKRVVDETPMGLVLDQRRALGFAMANQAGLDKRLRNIEDSLRGSMRGFR